MALDGHLLAEARAALEERRAQNEALEQQRRETAFRAVPALRENERALAALCTQVLQLTLHGGHNADAQLRRLDTQRTEAMRQRGDLLRAAHLPADSLDHIYTCSECHDLGYRGGQMCTCLRALYEEARAHALSYLTPAEGGDFRDFRLDWYSTEPNGTLGGISPRECMKLVFDTCRSFADGFGPASPNLLFRGGTGLGKTFLSGCIARTVSQHGHSVIYDTAVSAFEAFENKKFARDGESAGYVRRMLESELLILDDLGTEMTTSFTQSALYTIVNTRLSEGRKTIISTNLSSAEMAERYTAQIISRIEGEFDTLLFAGSDIRALRKQVRYAT